MWSRGRQRVAAARRTSARSTASTRSSTTMPREIDMLVNNAGSLVKRVATTECSEALYDEVMNLNVKSTYFITQAVLPHMLKQRDGVIVNLSSIAARTGRRHWRGRLRRGERLDPDVDEGLGARAGAARDSRQCGQPRNSGQRVSRAFLQQADTGQRRRDDAGRTARARTKKSRTRSSFSARMRRDTFMGRRSRSTAG